MSKRRKLLALMAGATVFGTVAFGAVKPKMMWYYHLTVKPRAKPCLVGPFRTRAAASDNLGSALYSHPISCHITGPIGHNCDNIGNGYGYLAGTPFPPTWQIPDSAPVQMPFVHTGLYGKFVRFYFGDDGSCTVVPKGTNPPNIPGSFTNYPGPCPYAPYTWIGDDYQGQGDLVCR
jgi:hypothetical protein